MENTLLHNPDNPVCFDLVLEVTAANEADDWIHTSCYSVLAENTLRLLKDTGVPVSYDFSLEFTEAEIAGVCPFIHTAFFSCGHISEQDSRRVLEAALERGCTLAIATRGAEGSLLFDGRSFFRQPAYKVTPVDTMGAGDSFIARFIQCYWEEAERLASCDRKLKALNRQGLDPADYMELSIQYSLSQAALSSAINCLRSGAFGHDQPLTDG